MAGFLASSGDLLKLIPTTPLHLEENEGFLVKDVVSRFYSDPDDPSMPLGMVVGRAQSSPDKGSWQYYDGEWQELTLNDDPTHLTLFTLLDAFTTNEKTGEFPDCTYSDGIKLTPDTRVRFAPKFE